MIDDDWLRATTTTADGTSSGASAAPASVTESIPPLTWGQRLCVGLGIGSIAAYLIYTMYRSSCRGPPQILWNSPSEMRRKLHEKEQQPSSHMAEGDCTRKSTLAMVNFPKRMRGQFEHSLRPLIDAEELELQYAPVVFYHEATEMTPKNVEAVVRQEVLAAFDDLVGIPCAVYHSALAIDEGPLNPFWSAKEALEACRGRVLLVRHCIGYTVDGGRVEILTHDTHGKVGAPRRVSLLGTADHRPDDVTVSFRRCFCATTRTFTAEEVDGRDIVGSLSRSETAGIIEGPYAECIDILWLSPVPLFAMFGAALRYSRVEFDGWRLLEKPLSVSPPSALTALQELRSWWKCGKRKSKPDKVPLKQPQLGVFMLEIDLSKSMPCISVALREALCEALGAVWETGEGDGRRSSEMEPISLSSLPGGNGSLLRCRLHPNLTVFQALREVWRIGALVACFNCDVRCLRLLCAVQHLSSSASATSETISATKVVDTSFLHMLLYPLSQEDMLSSYPSFFSSAQYFSLLGEGGRVEASDAFRRIQDGRVQSLYYVIAEYVTDELRG